MNGHWAVVLGLVLVTFVFAYSTPPTSAHSGDVLSALATVIPTIDGTISIGEWDDAATVSFIMGVPSGTPSQFLDSTLFIKNDDTNLYLAWVIEDEDFDRFDFPRFHFDNDHDGLREIGDDAIGCVSIILCQDNFRQNELNQEAGDACCGGTNDIVASASHTNPTTDAVGDYVIEVSHPLNTNDDSHDFSLLAGDTVGLGLEFFDSGIGSGWFPSPFASNWADIVIASSVVSVDIDIKPGSDPNCINTKNLGLVPVAILGSVDFDVTTIDQTTLEIDDDDDSSTAGVSPTRISIKDVNGDGFDDLNLKFATTALLGAGLLVDDNELFITGELTDSTAIVGSDIVNLAGGPNCLD